MFIMHFPLLAMWQLHTMERPWALVLDPGPPRANHGSIIVGCHLSSLTICLFICGGEKEIRGKRFFSSLVGYISAIFCLRNPIPSIGCGGGCVLRVRGWLGVSRVVSWAHDQCSLTELHVQQGLPRDFRFYGHHSKILSYFILILWFTSEVGYDSGEGLGSLSWLPAPQGGS